MNTQLEVKAAPILLVDDEPGLLEAMEWDLASSGYDVTTASDGSIATRLIGQREFDVIVTDVRMPGLTGVDVLKETRRTTSLSEVIITTGYAEMETVIECLREGAVDFLMKPITVASLRATVQRALERRQLGLSSQLLRASQMIATTDPARLPELIAGAALHLVGADSVGLWVPSRESVSLAHFKIREGLAPVMPLAAEQVLEAARGGEPTVRQAALIYPLTLGERLAGVLVLQRWANQRRFRRSDLERAAAVAGSATLALENVRLLEQSAANTRLAAIGQLAAGVAHEIKNPVAYVDANLDALEVMLGEMETGAAAPAWSEVKAALADAIEGCARIRDIVGDLKNMARKPGRLERVDLNEVVRAALRISAAEVRPRAKVTLDLGSGVTVQGDAGRLSQVLVNLLVNSAQAIAEHSSPGGEVTVRTWSERDHAHFSVRDNGPGISPQNQAQVFDAFFTTKAVGLGTGLGLPVSRDIVREHGGELELVSAAGEGACFVATLPLESGTFSAPYCPR